MKAFAIISATLGVLCIVMLVIDILSNNIWGAVLMGACAILNLGFNLPKALDSM